jgi:undecaprenyl-diphosphatase
MPRSTCTREERATTGRDGRVAAALASTAPTPPAAREGACRDRCARGRFRTRRGARSSTRYGVVFRDGRDAHSHDRAGGGHEGDSDGDDDDDRDRALIDLDQRVEVWIVAHRVDWLDPLFVGLTYAGTFGALWIALGVAAAVVLRRPSLALAVLAAVVLADLLASALKHATNRGRPGDTLEGIDVLVPEPSSSAFPSGHAATSFAAAVVLAVAVPALAPAVLVLAALVSFSRLYVGVHYPLDVLGGAALGVLVATALLLLARALRRSRSRRTRDLPTGR